MTFGGNNNYDALLSGLGESGYSSKPKMQATGGMTRETAAQSVDLWDYSAPTTTQAPTMTDYTATQTQPQDDASAVLKEVTQTLTNLSGTTFNPNAKTYTNTSQMEPYLVDALKEIGYGQYFGTNGEIPDWLGAELGMGVSI